MPYLQSNFKAIYHPNLQHTIVQSVSYCVSLSRSALLAHLACQRSISESTSHASEAIRQFIALILPPNDAA